jgi:hypothetical protein
VAFFRQPVFIAQRAFLIGLSPLDACLDVIFEPIGEKVPGHVQSTLKVVKTAYPKKDIPQDQERPGIANDGQRAGDRTAICPNLFPTHH